MAPPGSDREVLARDLAGRFGGAVRRVLATGSEPSAVPGMGAFWHLAPAFEVRDARGAVVATLVDDVTLVADLPRGGPHHPSWYRILSDDQRLLRLVAARVDPTAPLGRVLDPVAELFGTGVQHFPAATRVNDATGATIALAAPLPAGRERPCEVVTPPLVGDHAAALEALLAPARELGFTVPHEAAVHAHVDGAPFRCVAAFTDLVRLTGRWRGVLRAALGTNPACTRLGPLPPELVDLADRPWPDAGGRSGWSRLQEAARATKPVKFCDVNLTALLTDAPQRDTVEVRVLPGTDDGHAAAARTALVHELLERCGRGAPLPPPPAHLAADAEVDPVAARAALQHLARGVL